MHRSCAMIWCVPGFGSLTDAVLGLSMTLVIVSSPSCASLWTTWCWTPQYETTLTHKYCKMISANLTRNMEGKMANGIQHWLMPSVEWIGHSVTVSMKTNAINTSYNLDEKVENTKYLKTEKNEKLSWKPQVNAITNKSNKFSAFIHLNLKGCSKKVQVHSFNTISRLVYT